MILVGNSELLQDQDDLPWVGAGSCKRVSGCSAALLPGAGRAGYVRTRWTLIGADMIVGLVLEGGRMV